MSHGHNLHPGETQIRFPSAFWYVYVRRGYGCEVNKYEHEFTMVLR